MRVTLLLAGSVVCALVVWASVGQSAGLLYGALGWWALLALAWPAFVHFGIARLGD